MVVTTSVPAESTPWAYCRLDELGLTSAEEAERGYAAFSEALASGDLSRIGAASHNCFERVVLPERPVAVHLLSEMVAGGATFVRMSGSGPSVVGYFEDEDTAMSCVTKLTEKGITAHLCRPLI